MIWKAITLACALSFSGVAHAQPVTIEDASWLAGRWVGEGLGGAVEETWAPAAAGQMVGHFQLVRDGAVALYEIMLIDVAEGGLRMRVKHFNADFTAWEDKGEWHAFEPVSVSATELAFDGLILRRVSETEAEFIVRMRYSDGVRNQVLRLRRAPL